MSASEFSIIRKIIDCRQLVSDDIWPEDESTAPLHLPHGPAYWAIKEYNSMMEAYQEAHEELHEESDDPGVKCTELRARFTSEALVAAFLTGIKFAQTGNKVNTCECGTMSAETVEELHNGAWRHSFTSRSSED